MPVNWIQSLVKHARLWLQSMLSEARLSSPVEFITIVAFGSVFIWSGIEFSTQFLRESNGKLESIASVFGNALGAIGAVFSVLLVLGRDARKERREARAVKRAIGLSIIAKLGMVDRLYDMSVDIKSNPNPTKALFHRAFDEFTHVTWDDLESLQNRFHKADLLIPYAFQQLKLRERKVVEAFEKVTKLPNSYSLPVRSEAELLHSCCIAYLQALMFLSSRCEVQHEDWVYKKYPYSQL